MWFVWVGIVVVWSEFEQRKTVRGMHASDRFIVANVRLLCLYVDVFDDQILDESGVVAAVFGTDV
jgi:hypothetical protein